MTAASRPPAPPISEPPPPRVVKASAGSGKTYDLAVRYLALVRRGASPASILATTFTRKAAGEILGRVVARLAAAAQSPEKARALRDDLNDPGMNEAVALAMLVDLAGALHRVSISTIDSFFARMAQSFRFELRIPPLVAMAQADDPRVEAIRGRAIEAMLAEEEPDVLLDLLRRLHHDAARSSVSQAIHEIMGDVYNVYRLAPAEACWTRVKAPSRPDEATVQSAIAFFATLPAQFETRPMFAKALSRALRSIDADDWESFLGEGLGLKIVGGQTAYGRAPIPPEIVAAYQPLIAHARSRVIGRYAASNQATHDLLRRFDAHFTRLREAQGVMLFSDLPLRLAGLRARAAPGEIDEEGQAAAEALLTEIYYRLDGRVNHVLLDEFQDTSLEQWRVLRPIAEEVAAVRDGSKTFYCVGDSKQAIYGWRGGTAALFEALGSQLNLPRDTGEAKDTSYRSSTPVLEAVNAVFLSPLPARIFSECEKEVKAWTAGFKAHGTFWSTRPGYAELMTSMAELAGETRDGEEAEDGNGSADETNPGAQGQAALGEGEAASAASPHAHFAAGRIAELVARHPGRSVGVLVRRNQMVQRYIDLLRAHGVRASGEGGVPLTDDAAVNAALAAMTLADHPGDTASVFHVLNSPLAAVIQLKSGAPDHVEAVARGLRRALLERGYAGVIAEWALALGPSCDARGALRLAQLVELADAYDAEPTLRPRDFAQFVRVTHVEEPTPAAVRVMTVHKAKGLEFDVVVLPELDNRLLSLGQEALYIDRAAETGPIRGVYRAGNEGVRAVIPGMAEAYRQQIGRRLNDELSSLYVAMTRAAAALHMIIEPLKQTKKGASTLGVSNKAFASVLRGALAPKSNEGFIGGEVLFQRGDPSWDEVLRRVVASPPAKKGPAPAAKPPHGVTDEPGVVIPEGWAKAAGAVETQAGRNWVQVTPSSLQQRGRVAVERVLRADDATAEAGLARGSLVHAWFELVEYSGSGGGADGLTDTELREVAARLDGAGWPAAELDAQIAEFRRMLAQPAVAEALRRPGLAPGETHELWRERRFVVRTGGRLLSGAFDRVVVQRRREGEAVAAHVLDYKTDAVTRQTLAERAEDYRPQIEAYREALSQMLGLDRGKITATLLFVTAGLAVTT